MFNKGDGMNKVIVNIQGVEYTLVGKESEEYISQIGETVDDLLSNMLKTNRKLNVSTAAILTSCNLVDEKFKLEEELGEIDKKEAGFAKEKQDLMSRIEELESELKDKEASIAQSVHAEADLLKKKQEELSKCQTEISLMSESVREYRDDNEQLSKLNKELKFELQSYKYKVLDLQNKLFENQMTPTKEQKEAAQKQGK